MSTLPLLLTLSLFEVALYGFPLHLKFRDFAWTGLAPVPISGSTHTSYTVKYRAWCVAMQTVAPRGIRSPCWYAEPPTWGVSEYIDVLALFPRGLSLVTLYSIWTLSLLSRLSQKAKRKQLIYSD